MRPCTYRFNSCMFCVCLAQLLRRDGSPQTYLPYRRPEDARGAKDSKAIITNADAHPFAQGPLGDMCPCTYRFILICLASMCSTVHTMFESCLSMVLVHFWAPNLVQSGCPCNPLCAGAFTRHVPLYIQILFLYVFCVYFTRNGWSSSLG